MLKKTIGMAGFTLAEVLITLGIIGVVLNTGRTVQNSLQKSTFCIVTGCCYEYCTRRLRFVSNC